MEKDTIKTPISLKEEALVVEGKLYYSESSQAWSIIRLRSELVSKMPKLKEKTANISHRIIWHLSYKRLLEGLHKMEKNGEPVPMIMFLSEEKNGN